MSTEDKLHLTPFPPEDEKEAQKELNHLRKHIRNDGVFKTTHKWTGFQEKTLWDWLQLLLIPLVLTVGGLLFSTYQHNTDQQSALDQQQATILQTYFDNIQDLLLNHNLLKSSLDTSNPYHDVSILARARTLTAIQGLDPERKGLLVQFLYEAGLIGYSDTKNKTHLSIINLIGADLSHITLFEANLGGIDLGGADLTGADLSDADLSRATLIFTNLSGANLSDTNLSGADLSGTNFSGANLRGANLRGANLIYPTLTQQQLDQVGSCKNATLAQGSGLTCHN